MTSSVKDICISTIKNKFPNVIGIWLFGSTASNSQSPDSDVDLAMLCENKTNRVERWQCAQELASKLGRDVDLIDLIEASTILRAQIIQEGKVIYSADKYKCDLFETESLSDYLRFNDERKEILEDIKSRGSVFGHG